MKNRLPSAISLVAMAAVSAPAAAQDRHPCLDEACTTVSIVGQAADASAADASIATRYGRWGFDIAGMNRAVEPGDDWFEYVNGSWAKNTQIPADRSSYGAFAVLRDLSEARLRRRRSSSAKSGGSMKISTESIFDASLTARAPLSSSSRITCFPSACSRSISLQSVP